MSVEVNPGQQVRNNSILYKAGEVIHDLAAEVKADLVKLGVVKDLDADAATAEAQVKADAATLEAQAKQSEELERGQVENQVQAAIAGDLADNAKLAATPAQVVVNGKPTPAQVAATAAEVK